MSSKIKKVAVIGLGYVGLPTYVALSKTRKYDVVGYTRSEARVKDLSKGISSIDDHDVSLYLEDHKINVTNKEEDLKDCDVYLICVPTPVNPDYTPDYGPVISATKMVAKYLKPGSHFVLESTVNPGTCEEIVLPVIEKETDLVPGKDFNISHCPERVNPGDPKWNVYNINRNIGSLNPKMNREIADFYRSFITKAEINEVSCLKVAEATKIVENAFRDINIAYVNELAKSFDVLGIDLIETLKASANKPFAFINHWPGCGVGGHCIAVDPYYLIQRASLDGFNHRFLKIAREVNNSMPDYAVKRLIAGLKEVGLPVKKTKVTLLGLSYKADIGDLRESPALEIEEHLKKIGVDLTVYDPYVGKNKMTLSQAVNDAQAVIIATAHKEFVKELPGLLPKLNVKVIVDGRNCLDKELVKSYNIVYKGIGR